MADLAAETSAVKNVFIFATEHLSGAGDGGRTGSGGGETRSAMRHTMGGPRDAERGRVPRITPAGALARIAKPGATSKLAIANALWSDPSLPLAPAYVQRCRELFESGSNDDRVSQAGNAADHH